VQDLKKIKTASGYLRISANVYCPYCDGVINLFDLQELTDDGWLYDELLNSDGFGTENLNLDVDCPKCKETFEVGSIEW